MSRKDNNIDNLLADCLVKAGLISAEKAKFIIQEQLTNGKSFEKIIIEQGLLKPETIVYFKNNLVINQEKDNSSYNEKPKNFNDLIINMSAKKVFQIMVKIIIFLVSVHLIAQLAQKYTADFPLRDGLNLLFYMDLENNIPSVYSALTLLFSSIILGVITLIKKQNQDLYTPYWRGLSIIFAFLFLDELISLHERMVEPVRNSFNLGGFLYFAWVIPGGIVVLLFVLTFLKFIINLPRKTQNHFLIAGFLFISGAIGCELFGGYIVERFTSQSLLYLLEVTLEESLEMLGIAVFIYGLLSHLSNYAQGTTLSIKIPAKNRISHLFHAH